MLTWFRSLALIGATAFLAACGGSDAPTPLSVVKADARFSLLAEALATARLESAVDGSAPVTVFAPTNDAFAALLSELGTTKQALFADTALLTQVLTYHVLGSRVERAQVPAGRAITTAQGGIFKVDAVGAGLVVTDGRNRRTNITQTDVDGGNSVIHVVDRVLLPANRNIVQTAQSLPDFSLLVEAVIAANLQGTLSGTGPFTVFAPTNAAFVALLGELGLTKDQLFANRTLLTQVLTYHVLPARVLRAEVPVGTPAATVQGQTLTVGANLAITDQRGRSANIVATDTLASNGVIHVIDRVILPRP